MSSTRQNQGSTPNLTLSIAAATNEAGLVDATARFERYKVLIRKLAHQRSGTGQPMTKEERGELFQFTASCRAK